MGTFLFPLSLSFSLSTLFILCLLQSLQHLVVDLLVKNESARRGAALTRGSDAGKERRPDDHVQVRIVHDNDGVVAAEFEKHFAKAILHRQSDFLSNCGTSGERYKTQSLVRGNGGTQVSASAEKRADGGRKIIGNYDGSHDAGNGDANERSSRRAFPQAAIAANEGDGGVPAEDGDREIEGGDDADDAKGIPLLQQHVAWSL